MATFKAHGERLNAMLITKILNHQGIKTRFLEPKDMGLIVTGTPNNAEVNPETYVNLKRIKLNKDSALSFQVFTVLLHQHILLHFHEVVLILLVLF